MTETELLFTEVLNCGRPALYINKDIVLPKEKALLISSVLKRRVLGEPLEYILGKAEFMGLEFKVNKDVLIPRADTEILVEIAIKLVHRETTAKRLFSRHSESKGRIISTAIDPALSRRMTKNGIRKKILEIGTGSGCIAVSLAKLLTDVKITAVDVSKSALKIAKENAVLNNVADRINFIEGDLFNICDGQRTGHDLSLRIYDLIVTNPPYIPTQDIEGLQPEVKYEPRIALDGGRDGLDFYRKIIELSAGYLKEGGFLVMEIGFGQKEKIENMFQNTQDFEIIDIIKDYNGIDRVIVANYK
ncbi:MAG: HemK/PrmC family methyltransferase [Candidatus Omnitrophota bacterium]